MIEIYHLNGISENTLERIMARSETDIKILCEKVEPILEDVKKRGGQAVLEYTEKFDGVKLESLKVEVDEIKEAYNNMGQELLKAIKHAARNIEQFHKKQMPNEYLFEVEKGIKVGRRVIPLDSAGLYVPGGKGIYPSVMLMLAIPAKIAGVKRIVACTPPKEDGKIDVASIVSADLCGVDELYKIGGAQAIAAMAYGTETIPKVDVIAGPGNPYVVAAQRVVMFKGDVKVEFPPGPSEGMVLADKYANPKFVAADVLSEAEHGPDSAGLLVTDSEELAREVVYELDEMLKKLPEPRKSYVMKNLKKYSGVILAETFNEAVEFVNNYAVEHLVIMTKDPMQVMKKIKNAGTFCLGEYSPITAGNFAAGPNAILPTGMFAKRYSGVSVDTFIKKPTIEYLNKEGLNRLKDTITTLSEFEGFPAHTDSVKIRFENEK